jgi:hypothetical protein
MHGCATSFWTARSSIRCTNAAANPVQHVNSSTIRPGVLEWGIPMDVAEMLDQLAHAEGFTKSGAASRIGSECRVDSPLFLQEIDSYLALGSVDRAKPTPLFFIFHLLGEWQGKPPTDR